MKKQLSVIQHQQSNYLTHQVFSLELETFSASLQKALSLHQAGDYDEARAIYEALLQQNPTHPDVLNFLGLLCFEEGDQSSAIDLLNKAIKQNPDNAQFHNNLGSIFASEAKVENAIEHFHKAIASDPKLSIAYENLGNALIEINEPHEALEPYKKYIELNPDDEDGHVNYTSALNASGQPERAKEYLEQLLSDNVTYAVAYNNLGVLYQESGYLSEAIAKLLRAVEINPQYSAAYANLATAYWESKLLEEAETSARKALSLEPELQAAKTALGLILLAQGKIEEASQFILEPSIKFRNMDEARDPYIGTFNHINSYKVEHDIDQLEHLIEQKIIGKENINLIGDYKRLLPVLPKDGKIEQLSDLDCQLSDRFFYSYNSLLNFYNAPVINDGAINVNLDAETIQKQYLESDPEFALVDDFLSDQTLSELRKFCLESTIWYDMSAVGDLGASLEEGFCCPLLLQVANEIREKFPQIYGDYFFSTCWSYRYHAKKSGDGLHGDSGRVSVNIWLTPDDANLDPDGGGLLFWNKKVPMLQVKDNPKEMTEQILRDIIAEPDAKYFSVPYKCNRATLFNSNTVHKTDEINFKPGYLNRRLNITFVFGKPEY